MRAEQWPGLVTNASPFAIPPGAAVEQVNLISSIPGQVTTRGGMRKVSGIGAASGILDCFPYTLDGKTVLITQRADGSLAAVQSPMYGCQPTGGFEPNLSTPSAFVTSSYTYRYVEGANDAQSSSVPDLSACGGSECSGAADGGDAFTASWSVTLDTAVCDAPVGDPAVDGGTAKAAAGCDDLVSLPACGGGTGAATVPTAPRNLSVTFAGDSASLTWDAPSSDGGSPIIDYEIDTTINGGAGPTPLPDAPDPPVVTAWGSTSAQVLAWTSASPLPSDWTLELEMQASTNGGTTWTGA